MELAEIWQCGLSIDCAALAFEAKRSAYKSSKWKHRTTTTVLISPSCEKVGMAWKKEDIVTPLSPTVLSESSSVLCLQFQGISLTLSHLLPTTVQLFEIWGIYCSVWLCLTLHSFTKQLMPQWKTLKHSGVWCMVVFAVPTGRSNEGKGLLRYQVYPLDGDSWRMTLSLVVIDNATRFRQEVVLVVLAVHQLQNLGNLFDKWPWRRIFCAQKKSADFDLYYTQS